MNPEIIQTLGWTLIHFIWEGALITCLLYLSIAFCRTALVRYTAALLALILMLAAPVCTFFVLQINPRSAHVSTPPLVIGTIRDVIASAVPAFPASPSITSVNPLNGFVFLWVAGVLVLSTRALGGWFWLERLRYRMTDPVSPDLRARCIALQQRLGLLRVIRYCQSQLLQAPAVLGWFRPVVLLPAAALAGLSPRQLEAVIAHELAHIKRFDAFVNLLQVATETLLFYHPAVWWLSARIRAERENCCDDVAVAVCGNAADYARALTLMETWRVVPDLALAATGGSLKARVMRLLGLPALARTAPVRSLAAVGLGSAALALFAGLAFSRTLTHFPVFEFNSPQPEVADVAPASPSQLLLIPNLSTLRPDAVHASLLPPLAVGRAKIVAKAALAQFKEAPQRSQTSTRTETHTTNTASEGTSYIAGLESAGLKNLTADQLINLKIQGVTPDYIRSIRAEGLNPNVDELIQLKIQGVTPEYIREIKATGLNPTIHQWIELRVQGVSADYIRKLQAAGFSNLTVSEVVELRVQNVDPAEVGKFPQLGLKDVTIHDLVALHAMGVTPDYIREMQAAGLANLNTRDYISAKAMGITPEFIQKARDHGFTNLSLQQLINLKIADVL